MSNSEEILYLLYGPEYTYASLTLILIACAYCIKSINNPVGSLQIALGRTDLGFKWTLLRVAITPIILILGSYWGIDGMLINYLVFCLVSIVLIWVMQIKPMLKINFLHYCSQFIVPFVVTAILFFLNFFYNNNYQFFDNILTEILFKIFVNLAVFISIVYFYDKKNINRLKQILR
tara:strand:- start:1060 stop:1587 length:528 start_codon:yes stop_codon:yes gene_type:complete